ncbi:phage protein Gp36 family protein [Bremerella cremea]|uniref:phage protein Gp36 family protein n=1 Tax=Bremerella cremea TaxID=1031537 RepID=UPI0031F108AA
MSTTPYCTATQLTSILGPSALLRLLDDNEDGTAGSLESSYASDAIEQAASQMNLFLHARYATSDLVASDWCRWCNAYLAIDLLVRRRGNPADSSLTEIAQTYRAQLEAIARGELALPDAARPHTALPRISNHQTALGERLPVRTIRPEQEG